MVFDGPESQWPQFDFCYAAHFRIKIEIVMNVQIVRVNVNVSGNALAKEDREIVLCIEVLVIDPKMFAHQ